MRRAARLYAVALAGALLAATPAAAQDAVMALNPTTMVGYAGVAAAGGYAQRQIGSRIARRVPARLAATPAQTLRRASFRADPAVRNQVYARTVALVRKADPASAAALRDLLMSGKAHAQAVSYLARYGMSANNIVDASTLYLATAWFASRGDGGDPTPAQMRGLRRQVAVAMAGTPGMLTASDALKQEIAEASIIQAMVSGSLANEAARNPRAGGPLRAAAVRGVQASYQIDLSRMTLTAEGLR